MVTVIVSLFGVIGALALLSLISTDVNTVTENEKYVSVDVNEITNDDI